MGWSSAPDGGALIAQSPASQIRRDVADPEPDLAWQSSIGQLIFLQSVAQGEI